VLNLNVDSAFRVNHRAGEVEQQLTWDRTKPAKNNGRGGVKQMTNNPLRSFCDRILERGRIDEIDVRELQRDILADGFISRDQADMLIGLDRSIAAADPSWADFLIASLVEFVVWTSRPTGYVDEEKARWLVASLSAGDGPTATGLRAAFEIITQAQEVDQTLLAFAMRAPQRRSRETGAVAKPGLAA
jgi:hypothetical protein